MTRTRNKKQKDKTKIKIPNQQLFYTSWKYAILAWNLVQVTVLCLNWSDKCIFFNLRNKFLKYSGFYPKFWYFVC